MHQSLKSCLTVVLQNSPPPQKRILHRPQKRQKRPCGLLYYALNSRMLLARIARIDCSQTQTTTSAVHLSAAGVINNMAFIFFINLTKKQHRELFI